ncbi:hypothetical protein BSR47_20950 [Bradyrhizobium canariense]|nr:hypothetical protein BSR47_20950 [Bradyrhizobium canariense]
MIVSRQVIRPISGCSTRNRNGKKEIQMNDYEAKRYIAEHVKVPRLHVTIAKGFILKNFHPTTSDLINCFLQSVEAKMPQKLVLHPSVDPVPTLDAVVSAISWQLSACEAIWGLIANAAVFPASTNMYGAHESLQWTTVVPGSGGSSSGFSLEEYSIQVPDRLALPKSSNPDVDLPLTDPDFYLKELNLPGLVPAVETALREAVQCLRHGLYLACLAMLGRASEAAWIETGLALASAIPAGSSIDGTKIGDQLQDPFVGIGRKIKIVLDSYSHQEVFGGITRASGVKLQDLRNCVVWADCVRESRNSIHYGAEPAMSNSYEKVATLLIGAVPHIRLLAALREAARKNA